MIGTNFVLGPWFLVLGPSFVHGPLAVWWTKDLGPSTD